MALTQAQEDLEPQLRVDQMTVNIEKMRADMAATQKQLDWETRKFMVQVAVGIAAAFAAGAAVATYLSHLH
jgi:hypothetical protein